MTDRPIIFSAPMVRALLDGRKSMTRRLAWRSETDVKKMDWFADGERTPPGYPVACLPTHGGGYYWRPSPWQKVRPGDRLWVRETLGRRPASFLGIEGTNGVEAAFYVAGAPDGDDEVLNESGFNLCPWWDRKQLPAIHMPRWASRLTLTVTAVKIERLLDISEEDARAEGFEAGQLDDGFGPRNIGGGFTVESPGTFASAAGMFQVTWAKLHPDWDGYSSLEVVALTFTVARRNIDAKEP